MVGGKFNWEDPSITSEMQSKIDNQIKGFVDAGYTEAVKLLKKYRKKLDEVSTRLLEVENMDGEEFEKIMKG